MKKQNSQLIQARKKTGMTQAELADQLGVTSNAVCHYESGKRKPRGEIAKNIAAILEIPLEEII